MSTYNPKSVKELKSNAKGQLIGKYQAAIMVSLLVSVIEMIITSITESTYTGSLGSYLIRYVISLIIDLLTGIFVYGQCRFYLNLVRGVEPLSVGDVFYGFKHNMDKAVLLQGVFTLATFVSSIPAVLISTGIIYVSDHDYYGVAAALSVLDMLCIFAVKLFFGLNFYILCDNPDMTVTEILKKSLELMQGRKGKYIVIVVTMIPLAILSVCAMIIGIFWYVVYYQAIITNFYLDAIGEEPFNPTVEKEPSYKEGSSDSFY